jgi:hypothetical protein
MNSKAILLCLPLTGLMSFCQSQDLSKPMIIKITDSSADHFIVQCTVENTIFEFDEAGYILAVNSLKENSLTNINFWHFGYGQSKEGKLRSVGNILVEYWGPGWGKEREGKIKSIGKISIDYWASGYGKEKEGKIKSIDSIPVDYWQKGWGIKEGKIKSIGAVAVDYWSRGWGAREGKIEAITGTNEQVTVMVDPHTVLD